MPTFEKSASASKSDSSLSSEGMDRVLAIFAPNDSTNTLARSSKANVIMKSQNSYENYLNSEFPEIYQLTAGCALDSLFYPFQTTTNHVSGQMPSFATSGSVSGLYQASGLIHLPDLLPFQWEPWSSGHIIDRYFDPLGDANTSVVSSNSYYKNSDRFRDPSDIRSIGLRLPLIGVGWGFTHENDPYPSGSQEKKFIGNVDKGYQVDPSEYIAAPIDLRYDKERNVWSSPREGFWAELLEGSGQGPYTWRQKTPSPNADFVPPGNDAPAFAGLFAQSHSLSGYGSPFVPSVVNPAYCAARTFSTMPSGSMVYMRFGYKTGSSSKAVFIFEPHQMGTFPVRVFKDGGSDASGPSQVSSWTYTVKDMDNRVISTNVPLFTPRPYGNMVFQPSGIGIGMYDQFYNFLLLSAGEFPDTVFCDLTA